MFGNILIRGGQTAAHEYRMSVQIALMFAWIAGAGTLGVCATVLIWSLSLHEAYLWLLHEWAEVLHSFVGPDERITVYNEHWSRYTSLVGHVLTNPRVFQTSARASALAVDGLKAGLMLSGGLCGLALVYFLWRGWRMKRTHTLRGNDLVPPQTLSKRIRRWNRKHWHFRAYHLAGVPFPKGAENTHTIVCGTTGTGKTTLLVDLLAQIRARGERAVIYDKTGGFVRRFYDAERDVILNPLDRRAPHWSVFAEGRSGPDFDMMARALIPENKGLVDPFWVHAARILFARIADGLRTRGLTSNELLVRNLLKIDLSDMVKLLRDTSAQAIIDENSPKTALSVRAVMTSYLECLATLEDRSHTPLFSIRDWIRDDDGQGFLFLTSRSDRHETVRGLLSCWLEIAINTLLSLESRPGRRIWLILDEVPSLNTIPSLPSGMAESRQFGGCFVLGLQVWSAMREIYGRDGAETLSGLARTRLILSTPDKDTADWGARGLGNAEQTRHRESISMGANTYRDGVSVSVHDEIRPLVLPTQIMNLPDLEGYLRMPQGFAVAKVRIRPARMVERAPFFIERDPVAGAGHQIAETPPPAPATATPGPAREGRTHDDTGKDRQANRHSRRPSGNRSRKTPSRTPPEAPLLDRDEHLAAGHQTEPQPMPDARQAGMFRNPAPGPHPGARKAHAHKAPPEPAAHAHPVNGQDHNAQQRAKDHGQAHEQMDVLDPATAGVRDDDRGHDDAAKPAGPPHPGTEPGLPEGATRSDADRYGTGREIII